MPRLTEQEQQEILRYLEADKPLPDLSITLILIGAAKSVRLVAILSKQGNVSLV